MHYCRGTEHKKINLLFMLCRFDFRSGVDLNRGLSSVIAKTTKTTSHIKHETTCQLVPAVSNQEFLARTKITICNFYVIRNDSACLNDGNRYFIKTKYHSLPLFKLMFQQNIVLSSSCSFLVYLQI